MSFSIAASATAGDYTIPVQGADAVNANITSNAPFGLRIGSFLGSTSSAGKTSPTVVVPSFATAVQVFVWGAGGGGGYFNGAVAGSTGGAGGGAGYVSAVVPITGGSTLTMVAGAGGRAGNDSGGGGGGYSAVLNGTDALAIAGSGGGGAVCDDGACAGLPGQGKSTASCVGLSGTELAGGEGEGGGSAGTSLKGGDADSPQTTHATPGGGAGGNGGGGGGGYFGGGGGGTTSGVCTREGGGGGGSVFVPSTATQVVAQAGVGATAANASDPALGTLVNQIGGGGAGGHYSSTSPISGSGGYVIVRLAKP